MASKRKLFSGNSPKYKHRKTLHSYRGNIFQELSDADDDDEQEVTNIASTEIPPIVVGTSHTLTDVIKLLGQNGKYKRMSIGTKVMPNTLLDYEDMIDKLKKAVLFSTLILSGTRKSTS